jgi:hypothetical protein
MKSPLILMTNTGEPTDSSTTNKLRSKIESDKKEKFSRSGSKNASISTQTSVNYTILSPMSVANLNSTTINSAILCRICYNSDIKEPLLQPCDCSGTMGLIHRSCLERWLSQCNKNQCEICGFEHKVERKNRPFSAWIFRPIATKDSKNLINDLLCFMILTPLAFISTWYCVGFAFKFTENINKWESSGLVILTTFLIIIYMLWVVFSTRYHYKVFRDWQNKNQIVSVHIENDKVLLTKNFMIQKKSCDNVVLQMSQTSFDMETIEQQNAIVDNQSSPNNNIELIENPVNFNSNSNDTFKVESCVIRI